MEKRKASNPKKMRDNILTAFEKLPDDTRDIMAHFWILTLQEALPRWQKIGEAARKTNSPGGQTEKGAGEHG